MKAERSHLALGQCILCTNREVYLWHRLSQAQRTRPSVGSAAHRSVQKRASIGGAPACLFPGVNSDSNPLLLASHGSGSLSIEQVPVVQWLLNLDRMG